jgi:type II secretory pathway pseudopilin PulG
MNPPPRFAVVTGMTLVETVVCFAILAMSVAMLLLGFVKGQEVAKFQSAYQVAVSYAEQGLEYALYTPYTDFLTTNDSTAPMRYVSAIPTGTTPSLFYSRGVSTNIFPTTRGGRPITITNVNRLATETNLPLDDLGSYVTDRFILVRKPSGTDTNLDYVILMVSNRWRFLGRTQPPIVLTTIRNNPSILQ